jgi:hypothetical protein
MDIVHRHHRASRDVQVIFVPVPQAGSPQPFREVKPKPYPAQRREHWRSQRAIPSNRKALASRRLLDAIIRQEQELREMPTPNIALWQASRQ